MIEVILLLAFTFVCTTFNVWFIHWLFHNTFLMKLYPNHLKHHSKVMLDDRFLFTRISIPFLVGIVLLTVFSIFSLTTGIVMFLATLLWSGSQDFIHDQFHLEQSFLNKYPWFVQIRAYHFMHHKNAKCNYGIWFMGWDKLFGTLRGKRDP